MTRCTYTDPNVALRASLLRSPAVCEGFFQEFVTGPAWSVSCVSMSLWNTCSCNFWWEENITSGASGDCVTTDHRAWKLGFPEAWPSFFFCKKSMVWKFPTWSNWWASMRCLDLPFWRRSTRAGALKEEAHITSVPLGPCSGFKIQSTQWFGRTFNNLYVMVFAIHFATMMIYSPWFVRVKLVRLGNIHTVRNLVTIPQNSSQLKGIAMPEGQFQPRQLWVKRYAKHS